MNKTIEKIEAYKNREIEKALTKAKTEYEEANSFYRDTGYDRYYNKMQKREKAISELEKYSQKDAPAAKDLTTQQYREYLDMMRDMKNLQSMFFYLYRDFELPETSELRGIQKILEKYKY